MILCINYNSSITSHMTPFWYPVMDVLMYPCDKIHMCPLKTVQIIIGVVIFFIGIMLGDYRRHHFDIVVNSGITYWGSVIVSFISLFCCIAFVRITRYIFQFIMFIISSCFLLSTSPLDLCLLLQKISYVPVWCVILNQ